MKVSKVNFDYLVQRFREVPSEVKQNLIQSILSDPRVKNTEARIRWDFLYCFVGSRWVCDNLYDGDGCHDKHIDTALKQIMQVPGVRCDD